MNPAECGGKAKFLEFPSGSGALSVTWAQPSWTFKGQVSCVWMWRVEGLSNWSVCWHLVSEIMPPPTITTTVLLSAALSTDPCTLVLFSIWDREPEEERESARALVFVFLCIGKSQNYPGVTWKPHRQLNATLKWFESVFSKFCQRFEALSWVPHSNFKVPSVLPLKPLVNGENKLSFLACILATPTLCLLSAHK